MCVLLSVTVKSATLEGRSYRVAAEWKRKSREIQEIHKCTARSYVFTPTELFGKFEIIREKLSSSE